jgi:sentrin-specific protease 7
MRNGPSSSDGSPLLTRALDRIGHVPGTSSPKKRRRQDDDNDQIKSPTAKRHFIKSPQRHQNKNEESTQAASRSCEGSGPNVPIEIDDSQEVKTDDTNHHQPRHVSSPPARRKPSSRPKQTLHPSPNFEEISLSSFSRATSGHSQHEGGSVDRALRRKLDEDDNARGNARHQRAPAPSDVDGSLERREEEGSDPMEGISQSTHDLQLDGVNDGSVVRETPEPDVRSPALRNGWSRDDPLLL